MTRIKIILSIFTTRIYDEWSPLFSLNDLFPENYFFISKKLVIEGKPVKSTETGVKSELLIFFKQNQCESLPVTLSPSS